MPPKKRCIAKTKHKLRCKNFAKHNSSCCYIHRDICSNAHLLKKKTITQNKAKNKTNKESKQKEPPQVNQINQVKIAKKTQNERPKEEKPQDIPKEEKKNDDNNDNPHTQEEKNNLAVEELERKMLHMLRPKFKGGRGILTPEIEPIPAHEAQYIWDTMPDARAYELYGIRRSCSSEWKTNWQHGEGTGAEANVYESCKGSDCGYAVKVFQNSGSNIRTHRNEVAIARLMGEHGLGPRIYDTFLCKNSFFMVMEKIVGQTYSKTPKTPELKNKLRAVVNEMHRLGIYHKDLHQNNVLIRNTDSKIFIIDFGRSEYLKQMSRYQRFQAVQKDLQTVGLEPR
jgi:predicted Ser/Thr protein kinase